LQNLLRCKAGALLLTRRSLETAPSKFLKLTVLGPALLRHSLFCSVTFDSHSAIYIYVREEASGADKPVQDGKPKHNKTAWLRNAPDTPHPVPVTAFTAATVTVRYLYRLTSLHPFPVIFAAEINKKNNSGKKKLDIQKFQYLCIDIYSIHLKPERAWEINM
jgi:hypothetical protein